jgi:hypothetical protein
LYFLAGKFVLNLFDAQNFSLEVLKDPISAFLVLVPKKKKKNNKKKKKFILKF